MNSRDGLEFLGGTLAVFAFGFACIWIGRLLTLQVEDDEAIVVTRFGKLVAVVSRPGLHVYPWRLLPWVQTRTISLRRDFRAIEAIHVNDASGTSVVIDLWLEFRIADPAKALFAVADWDRSLQNVVTHAALSILSNREFTQILSDRTELAELLRHDIEPDTTRWGLEVSHLFVRNVSLLPDVSRQMFARVAARLERAKADVEEEGRIRVSMLDAETGVRIANLVAEAKGQYPEAIGLALSEVAKDPEVFSAYNELYALSLLRPHRLVTFQGFDPGEVRSADAAMLAPPYLEAGTSAPAVAPLTGVDAARLRPR